MQLFSGIEPTPLWHYFEEILQIPRPSDQEQQIQDYLLDFAKRYDLEHHVDKTGNLLIKKEASLGLENSPTLILQSHMDMVCEKNADINHDFTRDPIPAYVEADWVKSKGTTLGADDGIGMAAQLAILASNSIEHGPLECLFTVAEETGLTGAFGLEADFLQGRILLNLDSEDEGEVFIGCAGGIDTTAWFTIHNTSLPDGYDGLKLQVSGLQGGHSGDEIHKGLGNSIKLLTRFLWENHGELDLHISELQGGNLRNAIPREATCTFACPSANTDILRKRVSEYLKIVTTELAVTEPKISIELNLQECPTKVYSKSLQSQLLSSLYACPHGVFAWSQTMENMVETSTNLAAVKHNGPDIQITTSQRSSLGSAKQNIANKVRATFELAGARTEHSGSYPGWNPNPGSELVKKSRQVYQQLFGQDPVVRAIHAGLECGLFLEKYPDMDMISFGPTIRGAHSPDERLDIQSTQKFWTYLIELLKVID